MNTYLIKEKQRERRDNGRVVVGGEGGLGSGAVTDLQREGRHKKRHIKNEKRNKKGGKRRSAISQSPWQPLAENSHCSDNSVSTSRFSC